MPVSPQDFALWSELTGNRYPSSPAERMALAPEVYQFTRGIGRRGGTQMGGLRKAVDVIGKTALAAGALAGAAYLGAEGYKRLNLDDEPGVPTSPEPVANPGAVQSADITPPTTSDRYGQDIVPHQTSLMQAVRGVSPGKPTVVDSEEKPATQSHVISSSQTFSPGSELEQLTEKAVPNTPVRDRADELIAEFLGGVSAEQRQQAQIQKGLDVYSAGVAGKGERALKDILKEGRQEGISPIGQGSVRGVEAFRQSPEYAEMMRSAGASLEPEELVGAPGSTTSFSSVRPTPQTRVLVESPVENDSPIAEMVVTPERATIKTPVAVTSSKSTGVEGASPETIELARKAFGHLPIDQAVSMLTKKPESSVVTSQPSKTRVAENVSDATEKLLRQARSMRTSREEAGGMISQEIPTGPIHNISVSPANEVAVTYKTKSGSQTYNFDADPKYVNELVDRIQRGSFVKGQDSAGGFINAGRSMGLLQ